MNREQRLIFCKTCVNRKMDLQKGLICKITDEPADFDETCPDYKKDDEIKEYQNYVHQSDELDFGLKLLSFCVPIAGAVIYFTNKDDSPKKAQAACTAALWGMGIGILLRVLITVATA